MLCTCYSRISRKRTDENFQRQRVPSLKEGVEEENSTISFLHNTAPPQKQWPKNDAVQKGTKNKCDFVVDKDANNIDYANDDNDNYVNGNGK